MFLTERNKIDETTFADIDLLYFSTFIIDGIENLENLPRFVFIDEECGNLKVFNDDEELTRNINHKKKLDVSQMAC